MDQSMVNWVLGIANVLIGFILKVVWDSLQDLRKTDSSMIERVNQIEVLVVGNYPRKDEMQTHFDAVFKKLDRIEDKVDQKADKV